MNKLLIPVLALILIGLSYLLPTLHAAKQTHYFQDQVAVLMYHHVDDEAESSGTITTKLFREQLTFLQSKGYQFITLREFKAFMQGASVPDNAVLVTFDDGYQSFYKNAYPILKSLRIPAVNFIITGELENTTDGNIPFMTKEEISEMTTDTNFIDAQCHTDSFHYKAFEGNAALIERFIENDVRETEEQYKHRVTEDAQRCIARLKDLGPEPVDTFAYPFGVYDQLATNYIQEAGFRYAFTIVPGMATRASHPMQIPRINGGNPAIMPEGLHQSILRRAETVEYRIDEVPLEEALRQLGGKAILSEEGLLQLQYGQHHWTGSLHSRKLVSRTGSVSLTLQKPLRMKNHTLVIGLKDLEQAIGTQIVYNPTVQSFTVRTLPAVKK